MKPLNVGRQFSQSSFLIMYIVSIYFLRPELSLLKILVSVFVVGTYSSRGNCFSSQLLKVKAEIYTSTETGSIADKINTESFVIQTKEWVLIHETGNPVLTTEIVDGRLKLSWTPIKSSVKSRYYIYSSRASNYLMDSTFNNWYIDSSFFGGTNWITITYGANDNSGYSLALIKVFIRIFLDEIQKHKYS